MIKLTGSSELLCIRVESPTIAQTAIIDKSVSVTCRQRLRTDSVGTSGKDTQWACISWAVWQQITVCSVTNSWI